MSHKKHTTRFEKFKQFVRTHMPHFHFAWHAKVDIHLFRVIFVGLGVILLIVFVIILANLNTIRQYSTGTFADEQTRNDKLPKNIWVEPKPYEEGSWIVLIKPEKPQERRYVSYVVMIDNIYDGDGQQQMQFSNFLFRKNVDGGEEGIDLTDISRQGDRYIGVARLSYIKEGETLPEFQPLFEVKGAKPDISSAYLYYIEGNGASIQEVTAMKEERLNYVETGAPVPTTPSSPSEPLNDQGLSDCQKRFGGEYVDSYWYEGDGGQCNCTTADKSEHKKLFGIGGMTEEQAINMCNQSERAGGQISPGDDLSEPTEEPQQEPEPTVPSTNRGTGKWGLSDANAYCAEEYGEPYVYFRGCFEAVDAEDGTIAVCGQQSKAVCDSDCGDERYKTNAPAALCAVDVDTRGGDDGGEEPQNDPEPNEEPGSGDDNAQEPRAGGCPEGYEPYLDDFSSDRDMCICNDPSYTEVDMSYCTDSGKSDPEPRDNNQQTQQTCPSTTDSNGCGDAGFRGCFCGSDGQYWESCGDGTTDDFRPVGGSCTP